MVKNGLSQQERLIKLNASAKKQLEILRNNKNIKELEMLEKAVNEKELIPNK